MIIIIHDLITNVYKRTIWITVNNVYQVIIVTS